VRGFAARIKGLGAWSPEPPHGTSFAPDNRVEPAPPMSEEVPALERKIILLLAAVSFVNILDFVMVMPLGPAFAHGLGIPTARVGVVAGAYTAAAALAGLVGTLFLDRFDRRSALAVAMLGLVTATAAAGLARNFGMLVGARILAGTFGGPASSIGMAILADVVPPQRRGKALGQVMGAFALASVAGIPASVYLSVAAGWRAPFLAVAAMGLLVVIGAIAVMPRMRGHLERRREAAPRSLGAFLTDSTVLMALAGTVAMHMGTFILVPNLSAWVQQNLGLPFEAIGLYYLVGGVISFVAMRVGGSIVDRSGPVLVTATGSALMMAMLVVSFLPARPLIPVMGVFIGFMLSNSLRGVALNTLSTKVPLPNERARFMSAQSASTHLAASVGAVVSSLVLANRPDGSLSGMDRLGATSIVLAAMVPLLVRNVTLRIRRREPAPVARVASI
jgi:predicted MFS family arabinose efflux permease